MRPCRDHPRREGRLRGPPLELRSASDRGYVLHTDDDSRALDLARAQPGVHELSRGEAELRFQASEREAGALSVALGKAGVAILRLAPELATLEDLFFELTEGDGVGRGIEAALREGSAGLREPTAVGAEAASTDEPERTQ